MNLIKVRVRSHVARKRAVLNIILKKILRIHQTVIDRFSHIQGREGDFLNAVLNIRHTAFSLPQVLDILVNQIIESQPRLFCLQITLIYARVIVSEYSLGHRYIAMFMTSRIDWIKNTQQVHTLGGFFHCDTIFDLGPRSSPLIHALMQISDERVR